MPSFLPLDGAKALSPPSCGRSLSRRARVGISPKTRVSDLPPLQNSWCLSVSPCGMTCWTTSAKMSSSSACTRVALNNKWDLFRGALLGKRGDLFSLFHLQLPCASHLPNRIRVTLPSSEGPRVDFPLWRGAMALDSVKYTGNVLHGSEFRPAKISPSLSRWLVWMSRRFAILSVAKKECSPPPPTRETRSQSQAGARARRRTEPPSRRSAPRERNPSTETRATEH